MENQVNVYQQMHISGLNQKELIVMLYSGAIRFIEQGRELILKKDVPGAHAKLNSARNIFIHLLSTLNMEAGGQISKKLLSLYAYFIEKITMANATKNVAELDDIIPLIQDIKEAWEKVEFDEAAITDKTVAKLEPAKAFIAEV
ncbi:MAG: flagellar export chaperone FliS [candidate division Zixibacteria bacterium]|jgi:flagellar protein FliS|nr:flagellar export chaperone FliS [candidate division Zixibacteria bacterium]